MNDRLPPHSIEAEQGALGCLLLSTPEAIVERLEQVRGDWFYDLRHRDIFEAIYAVSNARLPVEFLSVENQLKQAGKIVDGAMRVYLSQLMDKVPSAENFAYYSDIVREKASLRHALQVCQEGVNGVYEHQGPVEPLLDALEASVLSIRQQQTEPDADLHQTVLDVVDALDRASKGVRVGLPTGYPNLDAMTALRPSEMFVIAARPSMGKTALALGITQTACEAGVPVGFISLEMDRESLVKRLLSMTARVNTQHPGTWKDGDHRRATVAMDKIKRWPLLIDDRSELTVGQIRAKARRWVSRNNIGLLVVDYLQLIASNGKDRREAVDAISRGLKGIAKELKVPVVVLAQLNRDVEKDKARRPRLSDLRESGQIEQDADVVGMLYCPDAEENPFAPIRNVNIDLVKQRNGETGIAKFTFEKRFTVFAQQHATIEEGAR